MHRPLRILRRAENVVRGTVDSIWDARYIAQKTGGIRHMPEDAMHRTGSIEREAGCTSHTPLALLHKFREGFIL
jgi:hypothetical protein